MKKKIIGVSLLGVLALLLFCGCSGVEPEKRAYPQMLAIDWKEEGYSMYFGMPNLSEATGQDKTEEDSSPGMLTFAGRDLKEIYEEYQQTQEKYLDLGHVKVLILGKSICQNSLWEQVLSSFQDTPSLGEDIYVFTADDLPGLLEKQSDFGDSLGEYLVGIYENRPYGQQKQGITLRTVYKIWYEKGDLCSEIPAITRMPQGYLKILD